eukprot:5779221-Amphidinium_carterae.1
MLLPSSSILSSFVFFHCCSDVFYFAQSDLRAEVHMSADLEVVGASLTPYMLEASRVAGALPEGAHMQECGYLSTFVCMRPWET